MSSRKLEPLIATSPEITIMPPDDGEDMAPTQRFDEAEDDDGVNRQTHERSTVSMTSGPRPGRVVDDASRWGSTAREREGARYLGIPQSDRTGRANPLPRCTRVAHATLRISKIPAHGAALSDMGYEPFQIETGADTPQTTPRKLALLPSSPLGLFGSQ